MSKWRGELAEASVLDRTFAVANADAAVAIRAAAIIAGVPRDALRLLGLRLNEQKCFNVVVSPGAMVGNAFSTIGWVSPAIPPGVGKEWPSPGSENCIRGVCGHGQAGRLSGGLPTHVAVCVS